MSDDRLQESWWLLRRARGVGLLLRILVVAGPLMAVGFTRLAAGEGVLIVEAIIAVAAAACVVVPDGHLGSVVVVLVGIEWLATVDDPTTPWSIAVAASLTLFHAASAAAGVAPPAARWTTAMRRRWSRRTVAVALSGAGTWAAVAAIETFDVGRSALLITAALLTLAVATLWARDGTLDARRAER